MGVNPRVITWSMTKKKHLGTCQNRSLNIKTVHSQETYQTDFRKKSRFWRYGGASDRLLTTSVAMTSSRIQQKQESSQRSSNSKDS